MHLDLTVLSEANMQVMTYTNARKGMKSAMDMAINDRETIVITRKNSEAVVMMSLDEYNSINETLRLVQSPENARRLRASIAQLDADGGLERELDL
ncbi:prevent-host-death protein [Roseivivax halodurans JCM 10272]|uniref:Antitoxin n=2 Tax=Roseivivax halodurans TaxID=93683 RepID=X7EBP2_9RHOB|nr:prevent-host-death protein [Roseivivax halodurans JCM 10272]